MQKMTLRTFRQIIKTTTEDELLLNKYVVVHFGKNISEYHIYIFNKMLDAVKNAVIQDEQKVHYLRPIYYIESN